MNKAIAALAVIIIICVGIAGVVLWTPDGYVEIPDQSQTEREGVFIPIYQDNWLAQSFKPTHDKLTKVKFLLKKLVQNRIHDENVCNQRLLKRTR